MKVPALVKTKALATVLHSHTARVSAVEFSGGGESGTVSCGFDSTVRTWGVERGLCSHTNTVSEKPFLALALPVTPEAALATLFDLRTGTSVAVAVKFPRPATPAALAFAQSEGTQFASGAYDGVVRIWDVRIATREVANARIRDGQKVLALSWAGEVLAVAGEGGVARWRRRRRGLQKEMHRHHKSVGPSRE